MNKLPFPEPKSDRTPITFEQYLEYTPEKLELWDGFYNYGSQDMTGFYLAVLTNMGLRAADRTMVSRYPRGSFAKSQA
jgi:hypothetical protein